MQDRPALSRPAPGLLDFLTKRMPEFALGIEDRISGLGVAHAAVQHLDRWPDLASVATGLSLWHWQRRPLSRDALARLLDEGRDRPFLSEPARAELHRLDKALSPPGTPDPAPLHSLVNAGEHGQALKLFLPLARHTVHGVFWLSEAWDWLLRLGRDDLPELVLDPCPGLSDLPLIRDRLVAGWAFHALAPDQALEHVRALSPALFHPHAEYLAGELLLRSDKTAQGREHLAAAWRALPWHPHLILKLHELDRTPGPAPEDLSDTSVLVYSWNKADLLHDTLEGLAKTDLRGARVVALDNGSSDGTAQMLARSAALFPENTFSTVSLPVNVGAPAARNWLLSLDEVRARPFAAFLDDDVILPPDWLRSLRGAMDEAGPETGTVGCRIISADRPACLQSADYNLQSPRGRGATFRDLEEHISIIDNCAGELDEGLFDYSREALSVSGCCHLLSMEGVRRAGDFDIRFSPTQFDDLERDMRLAMHGMKVFYLGSLTVRHVQHSSLAKAKSLASIGHVFGNRIKLEGKYAGQDVERLTLDGASQRRADLLAKYAELRERHPD